MTKKHNLIMLLCCLLPILAITAITIFRVPLSSVVWFVFILICPLSMILMMKFMMDDKHDHAMSRTMKHMGEGKVETHPHLPPEERYGGTG